MLSPSFRQFGVVLQQRSNTIIFKSFGTASVSRNLGGIYRLFTGISRFSQAVRWPVTLRNIHPLYLCVPWFGTRALVDTAGVPCDRQEVFVCRHYDYLIDTPWNELPRGRRDLPARIRGLALPCGI